MRVLPLLVAAAALAALPRSQSPQLRMDPAVGILGGLVASNYDVGAAPGAPFAVFVDLQGGPVDVLGTRLWLGLTPSLTAITTGLMPSTGTFANSFVVPALPGLAGLVLYGQAVVLDGTAPNGLFRVSAGASTAYYTGVGAIVAAFDNPVAAGFTGSFASDIPGHVRGAPVVTRTHRTIDPSSQFFGVPIMTPLVPFGAREQVVYRAQDVGATGQPELLTGVRWHAHPSSPVVSDVHTLFELRAGHTGVTPDYAVDPFSALPVAPQSGLSLTFAANTLAASPPQTVFSGVYVIDPAHILPGGYMPYPVAAPFRYDGVSSLLLEWRVGPSTAAPVNGSVVRLMVQSSANPFGRVFALGTATQFLIPGQATVATGGDNAMHDLELEFTRVESTCQSPWLDSQRPAPDYGVPIVAQSLPPGTSVQLEFRGAQGAGGTSPTAWSPSADIADGRRYLQFRIVFHASPLTGERPVVDSVVVPLQ